jgi:uncharacterized membrane protein
MKVDCTFSWELLGLLYIFYDNTDAFLTDLIHSNVTNCRLVKHLSLQVVWLGKYDAVYLIICMNVAARKSDHYLWALEFVSRIC